MRFSTKLRDYIVGNYGFGSLLNKGVIRVYGDPMPASPDDSPTGTLLGVISTNGIEYIPGINKDVAGLVVHTESPGYVMGEGDWRLKGKATGTAVWFRWSGTQIDDFGTNTNFIRVDGRVGTELFLSNILITPSTNVGLEVFVVQLMMSN